MAELVRRAAEKAGLKTTGEPSEVADQAIGLALDMDPGLASRLSPESLVSLLELGGVDDRVIGLVAQAIELELEASRPAATRSRLNSGALRRTAVRSLIALRAAGH